MEYTKNGKKITITKTIYLKTVSGLFYKLEPTHVIEVIEPNNIAVYQHAFEVSYNDQPSTAEEFNEVAKKVLINLNLI